MTDVLTRSDTMTLRDLKEIVGKVTPSYTSLQISDLEYSTDLTIGGTGAHEVITEFEGLRQKSTGQTFMFDTEVFSNFTKYMGMPEGFLKKLDSSLRSEIIKYFLDKEKDSSVVVTHYGNRFQNMYSSSKILLPPTRVVEMIDKVFKDTDVVSKYSAVDGLVVNIRTEETKIAALVGDITEGGVRFSALHGETPRVSAYMERLACRNGAVVWNEMDSVGVKGYTLTEILNSMEEMANTLLTTTVPEYLNNWKTLTTITASNPERLIHRLCREYGISTKIESRIIESAASLTDNSYYSIVNLVTQFQHADGIDETQYRRLQYLGGGVTKDLAGHRCSNCDHNLEV